MSNRKSTPFNYETGSDFKEGVLDRCKEIGLSIELLYKFLNTSQETFNGKTYGFSRGTLDVFKLVHVKNLCFVTGIYPEYFLLNSEEEENLFFERISKKEGVDAKDETIRKPYFTIEYWNQLKSYFDKSKRITSEGNSKIQSESLIEFKRFKSRDTEENTKFKKHYKRIADQYFLNVKNELHVFEVLFKGKPGINLKAHRKAQAEIFSALNKRLKDVSKPKLFYTRTLAVSSSTKFFPKPVDNRDKLIRAMVAEISFNTLTHVIECLDSHSESCSFYVCKPTWFRNYAMIDDILLTEDYVIFNNAVVPECLFINNVSPNSKLNIFKKSIKKNLETMRDSKPLTLEDIENGLKAADDYLDRQIRKRKEAIEVVKKNCPNLEYLDQFIMHENKILDGLFFFKKNVVRKNEYLKKRRIN